jgi:hypothetical protein
MLQIRDLTADTTEPWLARLRYAYADALLAVGRREEAREWFARAGEVDEAAATDAAERLLELDGVLIEEDEHDTDEDEHDVDEDDSDTDADEHDEAESYTDGEADWEADPRSDPELRAEAEAETGFGDESEAADDRDNGASGARYE